MTVPTNWLVPLFYAEMDASGANTADATYPVRLHGCYLTLGTGYLANTPYLITSAADAVTIAGLGSQLHRSAIAYFANDPTGLCYAIATAEGTTAAQGKFTFTGPATAAGTVYLEVGGQPLYIAVSNDASAAAKVDASHATCGNTITLIGDAIALLLTTHAVTPTSYPVSASNGAGTVTLTAKHKGELGNDICIKVNPLGAQNGQVLPAGLTCVVEAMGKTTPGATNASISTAISNSAAMTFDHVLTPWTDTTSYGGLKTEMNDTTGRWSYLLQQMGHVWAARHGTVAQLYTVGHAVNDQHISIIAQEGAMYAVGTTDNLPKCPNPSYELSAAYMGACAAILRSDPAAPCQLVKLQSAADGSLVFRAPDRVDRFTATERNTLLNAGIATCVYNDQGDILIESEITTYTPTISGTPDTSYQEVQCLTINQWWLRACRTMIETQFAHSKLNDARLAEIKGAIVALYAEAVDMEYMEDVETFSANIKVSRNSINPSRVDVLATPDLINRLRVMAFTNRFVR